MVINLSVEFDSQPGHLGSNSSRENGCRKAIQRNAKCLNEYTPARTNTVIQKRDHNKTPAPKSFEYAPIRAALLA
jgi:hypothetical protein